MVLLALESIFDSYVVHLVHHCQRSPNRREKSQRTERNMKTCWPASAVHSLAFFRCHPMPWSVCLSRTEHGSLLCCKANLFHFAKKNIFLLINSLFFLLSKMEKRRGSSLAFFIQLVSNLRRSRWDFSFPKTWDVRMLSLLKSWWH